MDRDNVNLNTTDDAVQNLNDILIKNIRNIEAGDVDQASKILNAWKAVLCSIKAKNPYEGRNLAEHSHAVDIKNGILFVEVDHPGWMTLLQFHKRYILVGINRKIPQLHITSLAFRLKKKEMEFVSQDVFEEKKIMQAMIEKEESSLKGHTFHPEESQKKEISPEVLSIFENLKRSMLTNSQK